MKVVKEILFVALAIVITGCLLGLANEKRSSPKFEENKGQPSANWKEYRSMVEIWPSLKQEKIESIRLCNAMSPEYGYDLPQDFEENVNTFGYRERAAEVVRWWPTDIKVPKEKLSECIKLIDKVVNDTQGVSYRCGSLAKMLIVTSKGNYIFPGGECIPDELSEFLMKYCKPSHEHWVALPPKEQTVAIIIFSHRHPKDRRDSALVWPPVTLFGDKDEAELLLCRSFEPKTIFVEREWLGKIVDEYEIAMKDAEEKRWREEDISPSKGYIVFLTLEEFYWKEIGIDGNPVFGGYVTDSKQIKKYFDELGLTKELLAGEPNKEN
jgi:hypothetical protein